VTQRDDRLFAAIETEPGMGRLAKVAALLRWLSAGK
jgi:hypothetical protein